MAILHLAGPGLADAACAQSLPGSGGQTIDIKTADWRRSHQDPGIESRHGDVSRFASPLIPYKLTPNVRPDWPAEAH